DYAALPDVALIQHDQRTPVDLSSSAPIQVARGSIMTDQAGSRRATLLFSQGTTASMTLSGGGTQPITNLIVRASEFTVGPNGEAAMPGTLPPNSGYTYALDLSVDEAEAAGATVVTFSKPVDLYAENFLHFPTGTSVPTGSYDESLGKWVATSSGR